MFLMNSVAEERAVPAGPSRPSAEASPDDKEMKMTLDAAASHASWSQWHQLLDEEVFALFSSCKVWRQSKCPPPYPIRQQQTAAAAGREGGGDEIVSRKHKLADEQQQMGCSSGVRPAKCGGAAAVSFLMAPPAQQIPDGTRWLPDSIAGPPYFFLEHQQSQEWMTVSRLFFDLHPEAMDAQHLSACRRPRSYIHNLPVQGRTPALLPPAISIQGLFADASWPSWDTRQKMCTPYPRPSLAEVARVSKSAHAASAHGTTTEVRQKLMQDMNRLGMVWAGGAARQLSVTELEVLLGYKPGHTDSSPHNQQHHGNQTWDEAQRFKWLHTAPSVHALALQLSVLKPLYVPGGIAVLSLCTGIAGPVVALHRLGIPVRVLVSLDTDPRARAVLSAWWEKALPRGILVQEPHDVRELTRTKIASLVARHGKWWCAPPCARTYLLRH